MREPADKPRRVPWELLALGAMVAIFFAPWLFTGRIFLLRDLFCFWYPRMIFYGESIRSGMLPLWNPYTGCGEPYLANIESAVLYPPNLLFLLLPANWAMTLSMVLHFLFMGAGVYGLCRLWRVSRPGALLAAVAFTFSTQVVTRIEFLPFLNSLAWMPVILAAYVAWLQRRTTRRFILLTLAQAMQLLAGYPEAAVFTIAAAGLYALFVSASVWRTAKSRTAVVPIFGLGAAVLLAALLAAPQLLPAWEAAGLSSNRAGVVDPRLSEGSVNPLMLLTLLFPSAYGVPGYEGVYSAPACFEYWLGAFYIGLAPVGIIAVAFVLSMATRLRSVVAGGAAPRMAQSPGPHRTAFLVTLLILSLLYAMGEYTPLFTLFWHAVPLLQKFRWPAKAMLPAVLAMSCLAGAGWDYLRRELARPDRESARFALLVLCILTAAVAVSLTATLFALHQWRGPLHLLMSLFTWEKDYAAQTPQFVHDAWKLLTLSVVLGGVVALWLARGSRARFLPWMILCLAFADVALSSRHLLNSGPPALLSASGNAFAAPDRRGDVRFFRPNQTQSLYGQKDVKLFSVARGVRAGAWPLADRVFNAEPFGNFRLREFQQAAFASSEFPASRIRVVGGVTLLPDRAAVMRAMGLMEFDPQATALTDRETAAGWRFDGLERRRVPHTLKRLRDEGNRITIEVDSSAPGLLVLSDTWYPGWRATVNGRPAPILKVNGAFRAVQVPAGPGTVVMTFRPKTFYGGLVLCGLGVAALVVAAGKPRGTRRARRTANTD